MTSERKSGSGAYGGRKREEAVEGRGEDEVANDHGREGRAFLTTDGKTVQKKTEKKAQEKVPRQTKNTRVTHKKEGLQRCRRAPPQAVPHPLPPSLSDVLLLV